MERKNNKQPKLNLRKGDIVKVIAGDSKGQQGRILEMMLTDRKALVETPLFPGYVFVQPRAEQFENIRYVRGSCGFVIQGSEPAVMPEKDLESVRILVKSGAALAVDPKLIPGKRVEVIAGPFMGIQGELIRIKSQDRLVINAHLVGSSVSVEVDADKISIL